MKRFGRFRKSNQGKKEDGPVPAVPNAYATSSSYLARSAVNDVKPPRASPQPIAVSSNNYAALSSEEGTCSRTFSREDSLQPPSTDGSRESEGKGKKLEVTEKQQPREQLIGNPDQLSLPLTPSGGLSSSGDQQQSSSHSHSQQQPSTSQEASTGTSKGSASAKVSGSVSDASKSMQRDKRVPSFRKMPPEMSASVSQTSSGEPTADYILQDADNEEITPPPSLSLSVVDSLSTWVSQKSSSANSSYESEGRQPPAVDVVRSADVDDETGVIETKIPSSEGASEIVNRLINYSSCSFMHIMYVALFLAMATGVILGAVSGQLNAQAFMDHEFSFLKIDWDVDLNVALLGNAYLFVNDVPRLLEAVSGGHVYQQSVVHSSAGSLPGLLMRGNGMYYTWKTEAAFLQESYSYGDGKNKNGEEDNGAIYDYGLCTVAQILMGQDDILSYGNDDGAYINDFRNPCIMDKAYFDYVANEILPNLPVYDYVVLADQTKRMAVDAARQESVYALANAYGPLIAQMPGSPVPVLIDTHAFWPSDNSTNMTGLAVGGNMDYFQALIYDAVQEYVDALAAVLPQAQQPLVAPIGVAYLTVYEESRQRWNKLFYSGDMTHASLHGSYLFAVVLYTTLFGHLPPKSVTVNNDLRALYSKSRKLLLAEGDDVSSAAIYPTQADAHYYRNIARRVVLDGYVPRSLRKHMDERADNGSA